MFRADSDELGGKRALVTGGTQGVGAAIVSRLAAAGAIHGAEYVIDGGTVPTI